VFFNAHLLTHGPPVRPDSDFSVGHFRIHRSSVVNASSFSRLFVMISCFPHKK